MSGVTEQKRKEKTGREIIVEADGMVECVGGWRNARCMIRNKERMVIDHDFVEQCFIQDLDNEIEIDWMSTRIRMKEPFKCSFIKKGKQVVDLSKMEFPKLKKMYAHEREFKKTILDLICVPTKKRKFDVKDLEFLEF